MPRLTKDEAQALEDSFLAWRKGKKKRLVIISLKDAFKAGFLAALKFLKEKK